MNLLLLIPGTVMLALAALFAADCFADLDDGPRDRAWIFVAVLAAVCAGASFVLFSRALP